MFSCCLLSVQTSFFKDGVWRARLLKSTFPPGGGHLELGCEKLLSKKTDSHFTGGYKNGGVAWLTDPSPMAGRTSFWTGLHMRRALKGYFAQITVPICLSVATGHSVYQHAETVRGFSLWLLKNTAA
ncbi:hypothetical protein AVEN_192022-1 [Araneus ventricosus]|uniref:Uncharacterized protein n=1 Tax=Araneus ventricosus TaxID=182803 RepID=A0A4Y2B8W3_ARAVE|nr:hypothetical protein AVEN_192022-1 [Araneus ventricosus]